jgi:glycosyltransferase involved in cell wall biosynthesis
MDAVKPCLLIPHYNQMPLLGRTLDRLAPLGLPAILVDDGSSLDQRQKVAEIAKAYPWVTLQQRPINGGKGAAVKDGILAAAKAGYSHALQVDADGQHALELLPGLLDCARRNPDKLILGKPVYGPEVPRARLYGRWITHLFVFLETLSFDIRDSMCGFRAYPLAPCRELILSGERLGDRMDFDPEIVVRLHWRGLRAMEFPVPVSYPPDGISHFSFGRENRLISMMHTRLCFGLIPRLPRLLLRKFRRP